MDENRAYLREDGNIVIEDTQNGNVIIDQNRPEDILQKLQQLRDTQINLINQLAKVQSDGLNHLFKTLLQGLVLQKNVVHGSVSANVVNMGDKIQHNYHPKETKIPKELTAKIPRTPQDKIVGRDGELDELHRRLFDNKQVVLVNGLGGIGKTTLAQVYISRYWDEYY